MNEYTTNDVVIYPNPAKDMVNVTLNEDSENISWTLINMHGQVVKKMNEVSGSFEIDLNDVDKGIYFLNVSVDDKPIIKKIVVE